ncbi:MAG TPA: hypothetical protein PKA27_14550 [Fimbriimonadaceae bacterium]|nr:hypothetical protein [Fimbriimonadaceae bacterium]
MTKNLTLALLGLTLLPSAVTAQLKETVNFRGAAVKDISGRLKGREYVDYLIDVGAGQSLAVSLDGKAYFNVNPPKSDISLFVGSRDGNTMELRMLPSDGRYIVRVYQMGAARSENQSITYKMTLRLKGKALVPVSGSRDAKMGAYHAKGIIDCTISGKDSQCDALVIRRGRQGEGTATVEFRTGNLVRRVLFIKGQPMASDSPDTFSYRRSGDITTVRFGDKGEETYVVPDALMFGG